MGYGRERLSEVFDLVKDPENWKMPVDGFVPEGQATVGEIEAAVIFFTGSVPDIYPCEASGGRDGWAVLAAGYYEAVDERLDRGRADGEAGGGVGDGGGVADAVRRGEGHDAGGAGSVPRSVHRPGERAVRRLVAWWRRPRPVCRACRLSSRRLGCRA